MKIKFLDACAFLMGGFLLLAFFALISALPTDSLEFNNAGYYKGGSNKS